MLKVLKEVLLDDFWIMPATPKYTNEGIPYITSKNIKNGKIDFENANYINTQAISIKAKYQESVFVSKVKLNIEEADTFDYQNEIFIEYGTSNIYTSLDKQNNATLVQPQRIIRGYTSTFLGWYTNYTDNIQVIDANGNISTENSDYTKNGKFIYRNR